MQMSYAWTCSTEISSVPERARLLPRTPIFLATHQAQEMDAEQQWQGIKGVQGVQGLLK